MKKITSLIISLLLVTQAWSQTKTFESGGINYGITGDNTVSVFPKTPMYAGDIVIPDVVMHEGTTYQVAIIGHSAFSYCEELTSITIPSSVTYIGSYAFSDCNGLTSVTIPSGVIRIGIYAFSNCKELTSVTLSNTLTFIERGAFSCCMSLTSIDIPNSVMEIQDLSFFYCINLHTVIIGKGVGFIGDGAFSGCSVLKSITVLGATPAACLERTFDEVFTNVCNLFVPKGSLSLYKNARGWKEFKNIIEEDLSATEQKYVPERFIVYPNPVMNGQFTIESVQWQMYKKTTGIQLYRLNGVFVAYYPITSERMEVDISHLPSGTYLIKVGETVKRIVKQ